MISPVVVAVTAAILTAAPSSTPESSCLGLIKGPMEIDVDGCRVFEPKIFDPAKPKYEFIKDLDPEGRRNLLESYNGLILHGTVAMSEAIKDGVTTTKGALKGSKIYFFSKEQSTACSGLVHKRIKGLIFERCCNGTADVPCLLGTSYVIAKAKVEDESRTSNSSNAANSTGKKTEGDLKSDQKRHKKNYNDGEAAYQQKKYQQAIKFLTKAEADNDIDVPGLYHLGNSYRQIERCEQAIAPLKKIWDLQQGNKIYVEDDLTAREGIFLLARCHAKEGQAAEAVFYLNGFLLDPKKYHNELELSLKHRDFGWIHTSKEYQQYKSDAERKLSAKTR